MNMETRIWIVKMADWSNGEHEVWVYPTISGAQLKMTDIIHTRRNDGDVHAGGNCGYCEGSGWEASCDLDGISITVEDYS